MSKIVNKIIWFIEQILIVLLACSVIIIAMQVFFRYFVGSPLGWTEQLGRYVYIWMVMLGIPLTFHRKISFAFDMLLKKMSQRLQRIIELFIYLLTLFFASYYFYQSLQLCVRAGPKIAPGLEIPYMWVYTAQPVGTFLIFIVVLDQIIDLIKSWGRKGGNEIC